MKTVPSATESVDHPDAGRVRLVGPVGRRARGRR